MVDERLRRVGLCNSARLSCASDSDQEKETNEQHLRLLLRRKNRCWILSLGLRQLDSEPSPRKGQEGFKGVLSPAIQLWKREEELVLCALPPFFILLSTRSGLHPLGSSCRLSFALRSSRCLSRLVSQHRTSSVLSYVKQEISTLQKLARSLFPFDKLTSRTTRPQRSRLSITHHGRHAARRQPSSTVACCILT